MKHESKQAEKQAVLAAACAMVAAARTAPKGRGLDYLETWILEGDEKDAFAGQMRACGKELGAAFLKGMQKTSSRPRRSCCLASRMRSTV